MALAVDQKVYLNVNGGIRSDPPLFGRVNVVAGASPDVVVVNWENGANQSFDSAAPTGLIEVGADAEEATYVGKKVALHGTEWVIMRVWKDDPSGTNVRMMLLGSALGYVVTTFKPS